MRPAGGILGQAVVVIELQGLLELSPNHAKIKTRKAWSEGASLCFVYDLQPHIGFPWTVSLTKTEKKGREKKEQLVKDVMWTSKTRTQAF
jgi:hypothetical protein